MAQLGPGRIGHLSKAPTLSAPTIERQNVPWQRLTTVVQASQVPVHLSHFWFLRSSTEADKDQALPDREQWPLPPIALGSLIYLLHERLFDPSCLVA